MRLKLMSVLLFLASMVPGIAHAQSSATKICVWADSEDLGVLIPTQPGGSVNSISGSQVSFIQTNPTTSWTPARKPGRTLN
jgi:hypothetical protein